MLTGTPAYTPPVTRATFRRSAIAAAVVAVIALAVLVPMGLGLYAVFGAVGLGLGVLNSWLVMRAVVNFAAAQPTRGAFTRSVLGREYQIAHLLRISLISGTIELATARNWNTASPANTPSPGGRNSSAHPKASSVIRASRPSTERVNAPRVGWP